MSTVQAEKIVHGKTDSDEVVSLLDDDDSVLTEEDADDEGITVDDTLDEYSLSTYNEEVRLVNQTAENGATKHQHQSSIDKIAEVHHGQHSTTPALPLGDIHEPPSPRNSVVVSAPNSPCHTTFPITELGTKGIAFDMNQPWERSLLRQLANEVEDDDEEGREMRDIRAGFLLLGHTESTDFGLPIDQEDVVSLGTSVSSTIPTRTQLVHRTILNRIKPAEEIFEPHQVDTKKRVVPTRRDSVSSQLTEDERDDNPKSSLPAHLIAVSRIEQQRRANAAAAAAQGISLIGDGKPIKYCNDTTYAPQDPACFCLGYNVLDYVIPPQQPYLGGRRQSMARRNSTLFRVDEYPADEEKTHPSTKSLSSPVYHAEPDGAYEPFALQATDL